MTYTIPLKRLILNSTSQLLSHLNIEWKPKEEAYYIDDTQDYSGSSQACTTVYAWLCTYLALRFRTHHYCNDAENDTEKDNPNKTTDKGSNRTWSIQLPALSAVILSV
jgi:hypothetical protein